ncbi:MAG: hypothetical protein LBD45_08985 [Bacteroidales bacterium]|jgi:hypothetical protein|nr:hypothetical protein [Bacteroidales bacterium]
MKHTEENGSNAGNAYAAPQIDVLHVRTEAGFAATSLKDLDNWDNWDGTI